MHVAPRPTAKRPFGRGKRLGRRQVADDRQQRVVRREPLPVKCGEVVAGDPLDRLDRALARTTVRMPAKDEPIEHDAGDVVRIVVRDLQRRERLPLLQRDLGRRERRVLHHVGDEAQRLVGSILDDGALDPAELVAGGHAKETAGRIDERRDRLPPTSSSCPD